MRNLALLLLGCAGISSAQSISFGLKGGGILTEPAGGIDQSRRWTAGPVVEIGSPFRLALEVNALYSRFGTAAVVGGSRVRGHVGEFPVLGKYSFTGRRTPFQPFASAGFAFRNIWLDRGRTGARISSTEPGAGAVFGGGVSLKSWRLTLSPEVRYTRWGGFNSPATNPNQVQALLGITF